MNASPVLDAAVQVPASTQDLERDGPTGPETPVSISADLSEMFREIYQCRELLWQMTLRDLRLRYKQAVMGFLWAMLMPMMVVMAGIILQYAMSQMAGRQFQGSSLAGMAVKSLAWAFFVGAVNFATVSLVSNSNLITKIYFPREVFPFSCVLTQVVDSSIGSAALLILLFGILQIGLSIQVLWAIPLLAFLIILTAGVSLILATGNLFFRDVKYIVQILMNFGIFFVPVLYEPQMLGPRFGRLMMLNPLATIFEGLRLAIVERHNLLTSYVVTLANGTTMTVWEPWMLLFIAVVSIVTLLASWLLFHKLEFIYAEYI